MNAKGVYYGLVEAQNLRLKDDDQKELEDEKITGKRRKSNRELVRLSQKIEYDEMKRKSNHLFCLEKTVYRGRSMSIQHSAGNLMLIDEGEISKKANQTSEEVEV